MATLSIFAHTSDDDGSNFVNCENTRDPYGPKYIITAPKTILFYALDRPADFNQFFYSWMPDAGAAQPVATQGGPKYTGAGRYAITAPSDPETFKVTLKPGETGQLLVALQNNDGPDYNALIIITLAADNSLTWNSPNADPSFAIAPGPPLGSGGGTPDPEPDPIPVIPGDKELGWWVAPGNANNLDSNPGASYGLIVKTNGTGEENRGWGAVYGGVVNPDRREVIWNVESWNPITPGTPAPNIEFPILLGTLETPDGVKISNPEQSSARRFGVLKLRATVGGVYAVNRLVLAMSPGGLYGTTAFSTEVVPLGAKEFWTGFRNTYETV